MNETTKNRDIEKYYVKVPIELIKDTSISNNARAMLTHIMSDSNEFDIYLANLANRMNVNYRTAQRYMVNLQDGGYAIKRRINGKWEYHIFFKKVIADRIVKA